MMKILYFLTSFKVPCLVEIERFSSFMKLLTSATQDFNPRLQKT